MIFVQYNSIAYFFFLRRPRLIIANFSIFLDELADIINVLR